MDWNQPIEDFEFLNGLLNLEVFSLGFVINKSSFPAFLPVLKLKNLKKIHVGRATFPIIDYAFLETALPNIEGCSWELFWDYDGKFDFLGKRSGFINKNSPFAEERCKNFKKQYQDMKRESSLIIDGLNSFHLSPTGDYSKKTIPNPK